MIEALDLLEKTQDYHALVARFERKHKIVFLGQICWLLSRQKLSQEFSASHLNFLLRPGFAADMDMDECPLSWINPIAGAINALAELDVFNNFPADLEDAESRL